MRKKLIAAGVVATGVAALAVPAPSMAHVTVSAIQPQGPLLTGARTAMVVRAPNETAGQNTFKVVMYVPAGLQESISVRKVAGWRIRMNRVDTGAKDAEGAPVKKTTRISWTATSRSAESEPGTYVEFPIRVRNPATPLTTCIALNQYYTNASGSRSKPLFVGWSGAPDSEHPASCLTFVEKA